MGFWGVLVNWVRSLPLRLELDQYILQKEGKLHTLIEDSKGWPLLLFLEDFMKDYFGQLLNWGSMPFLEVTTQDLLIYEGYEFKTFRLIDSDLPAIAWGHLTKLNANFSFSMRSYKEVESKIARVVSLLHEEIIKEGHLGDLMPEIVHRGQKVDGLLV